MMYSDMHLQFQGCASPDITAPGTCNGGSCEAHRAACQKQDSPYFEGLSKAYTTALLLVVTYVPDQENVSYMLHPNSSCMTHC